MCRTNYVQDIYPFYKPLTQTLVFIGLIASVDPDSIASQHTVREDHAYNLAELLAYGTQIVE